MKTLFLFTISLFLTACSNHYSSKNLAPSCQDYFQIIESNLSQSSLANLSDVRQSFNQSKKQLDTLPIEKQSSICNIRMAMATKKAK